MCVSFVIVTKRCDLTGTDAGTGTDSDTDTELCAGMCLTNNRSV